MQFLHTIQLVQKAHSSHEQLLHSKHLLDVLLLTQLMHSEQS